MARVEATAYVADHSISTALTDPVRPLASGRSRAKSSTHRPTNGQRSIGQRSPPAPAVPLLDPHLTRISGGQEPLSLSRWHRLSFVLRTPPIRSELSSHPSCRGLSATCRSLRWQPMSEGPRRVDDSSTDAVTFVGSQRDRYGSRLGGAWDVVGRDVLALAWCGVLLAHLVGDGSHLPRDQVGTNRCCRP
jgi:hypothetical protein